MGKELAALKAQPAVQEPWGYGRMLWDDKLFLPTLPSVRDGGWMALYTTPPAQPAPVQEPVAKSFMVHLYNFGYKAGHHDTVEGRYIDICRQDMETYHLEDVSEWLQDMVYTTPPAQPAPAWMEMVTANLVREGVNKHKARELAEHFYGLAPASQPAVPDAFGTREGEHPQYIQGWNDCRAEMLKGMKP
jgi:hypothetical protein